MMSLFFSGHEWNGIHPTRHHAGVVWKSTMGIVTARSASAQMPHAARSPRTRSTPQLATPAIVRIQSAMMSDRSIIDSILPADRDGARTIQSPDGCVDTQHSGHPGNLDTDTSPDVDLRGGAIRGASGDADGIDESRDRDARQKRTREPPLRLH